MTATWYQIPLRTELRNLLGLVKFCWRHGVVAAYRWQFWWQLIDIYRKNQSRLKKYLIHCFIGESIFWVRREVLRLAAAESGHWGSITYTRDSGSNQAQEDTLKAATT